MARLQILELPEGASDDRPPFVLVVDQYEPQRYILGFDQPEPVDQFAGIAEQIGARAVLVFEETIDIPANDLATPVDEAFKSEVQDWAAGTNETLARIVEAISGQAKRTSATEGLRLAHERTDIARDMDRLANHKAAITDALGIDRLLNWDDIRNAVTALRRERDEQATELERLYAGEEPVTDTRVTPTPAQWIWQWNRATPEKRLDMAKQIFDAMPRADNCFMADHDAQIAHLRDEVARLRGEPTKPDA